MSKYFVVAGSKHEFEGFIKKKTLELYNFGLTSITMSHFVYVPVNGFEVFRGINNPHGWFVGSWQDRPDLETLFIYLAQQMSDDEKRENLGVIYREWKQYALIS